MSTKICRVLLIISICAFTFIYVSCKNSDRSYQVPQKDETRIIYHDYEAILDSVVPLLLKKYRAPSAGIAVVTNNTSPFTKVYGEHRKGMDAPENTIYNIASITKPIVATTVMKLVANGDWDLDQPLYEYYLDSDITDYPYAKLITTRHCLSHTTGFKNWRWDEDEGKLKINFKPGTQFQYSGEGMEFLRMALESKFKKGLEKIIDSLIFKPVGMNGATMGWLKNRDTLRFAKWYDTQVNLHKIEYKIDKVNAADDMLLSMQDFVEFSKALLNYKILDESTFDKMIRPQTSINEKLDQGLGWVLYDGSEDLGLIINHDGGDPGVVATLIMLPKYKTAIAISVNSDNGASVTNRIIESVFPKGRKIIEGLHWDNEIPEEITVAESDLQDFAGTYITNQKFDITFESDGSRLITDSPVFPRVQLYPKAENEFYPLPFELYFQFEEIEGIMSFRLLNSSREIELTGIKKQGVDE